MGAIVVAGALANKPRAGGSAWVRASWVVGLERLGHEVVFVEQVPEESWESSAAARAYFWETAERFGFAGRAALIRGEGPATEGLSWEDLLEAGGASDLLVNISGHLTSPALAARFGRRAFVDLDPGYTQIWHELGLAPIAPHDLYFTIAENIGEDRCTLPASGLRWLTCRQPVLLDEWPAMPPDGAPRFTTIATWRTPFGRLEYGGRTFGMKLDEFRKVAALPTRVDAPFELALEIHPDERPDLELLARNGWHVVDAAERVSDADRFRRYVSGSGAEFSTAQGVYVETWSGWFSDRSVRYLAAGKPVLVQDTGFGRTLPVGEGLLAFSDLDDAVAGAEAIARDYERHSNAARAIAETHFAADRVLTSFLESGLA